MLMGLNDHNQLVYAQHASTEQIYRCPECMGELILRKGKHTIHHFAHKSNSFCLKNSYKKESIAHLASKHHIYSYFNNRIPIDMEYYLHEIDQIPDIIINKSIVIEFQYSPINLELLVSRSEGFKALNMKVIWIGKEVNFNNGMLKLSYFEAALINHEDRTLITYNPNSKTLIRYESIQSIDQHLFIANRKVISWDDLLVKVNTQYAHSYYLTDKAYRTYITKCRRNRSVLEPTLSLLYQAGLIHQNRREFIGIVVPEQIYFLTHCITWQTYIYYEMQKGTFCIGDFQKFIKFRTFFNMNYSEREIVINAVSSYLEVIKQQAISRAKNSI
nr:competence protein CoiA family protein [Mammaliicoccus sp. Marseille-Q6498]